MTVTECDNEGCKNLLFEMLAQTIDELAYEIRHDQPGEATQQIKEGGALALCLMSHTLHFHPGIPWVIERAQAKAKSGRVPKPSRVVLSLKSTVWGTAQERAAYIALKLARKEERLSKQQPQPIEAAA